MRKETIDKFELYSFTIYLYFYAYSYSYLFQQTLINFILYSTFKNIILQYLINHNIIKFMTHTYWKNNLNEISAPQLFTCISNIYLKNNLELIINNNYIILPINLFIDYIINKIYKNEKKESKNLRFIITIFFFFIGFIF